MVLQDLSSNADVKKEIEFQIWAWFFRLQTEDTSLVEFFYLLSLKV